MNFFIKMICIVCFSLAPLSVEAASTKKAFVQHQDWVKFISKDHRFSIDFPLSPEHNGGSIEVPDTAFSIHYDTYISAYSDQIIFVVSVWEYPPVIDLSQPEINLNEGYKVCYKHYLVLQLKKKK